MKKTRLILKTKKPKKGYEIESDAEFTGQSKLSFNEQKAAINWVNKELSSIVFRLEQKGFDPATMYFSIAVKD